MACCRATPSHYLIKCLLFIHSYPLRLVLSLAIIDAWIASIGRVSIICPEGSGEVHRWIQWPFPCKYEKTESGRQLPEHTARPCLPLIARSMGPTWVHLGPTGPRWAPSWPHELCYLVILSALWTNSRRVPGAVYMNNSNTWWCHGSVGISILLPLCEENPRANVGFP